MKLLRQPISSSEMSGSIIVYILYLTTVISSGKTNGGTTGPMGRNHREKREAAGFTPEVTFAVEKLGSFTATEEIRLAETVPFKLTISLPSGITDLSTGLLASIEGSTVFTFCAPRVGHVGSNIQGLDTGFEPTFVVQQNYSRFNQVTFDFGSLTNSVADTSEDSNSQIEVEFDAVLQYSEAGTREMDDYRVTAGLVYQDADIIAVDQVIFTAANESSSSEIAEPIFDVHISTGGTTMTIGSKEWFSVNMTFPMMSTPLSVNLTMPTDGREVLATITDVRLDSVGSNFACSVKEELQAVYGSISGTSQHTSARIEFGVITNHGPPAPASGDDDILFSFEVQLNDHASLVDGQQLRLDVHFDYSNDREVSKIVMVEAAMARPELDVSLVVDDTAELHAGDTVIATLAISHTDSSSASAHGVVAILRLPHYVSIDEPASNPSPDWCINFTEGGAKLLIDRILFGDDFEVSLNISLDPYLSLSDYIGAINTTIPVDVSYHKSNGTEGNDTVLLGQRYYSSTRALDLTFLSSEIITNYERGYIFDSINGTLFVCMSDFFGELTRCSRTADFGESWKEIDNIIATINYINQDGGRLFGLASAGRFIMASDDLGSTWFPVSRTHLIAVLASLSSALIEATVVPGSKNHNDTSALDLMVTGSGGIYVNTSDCGEYCSDPPEEACLSRFGINVIEDPDIVLTASSTAYEDHPWTINHGPDRAALFESHSSAGTAGWSPDGTATTEWIQVDFGYPRHVSGVLIQGRGDFPEGHWVTSFKVLYSNDGGNFHSAQTFAGTHDADTVRPRYFGRPVFARYFRINPLSWEKYPFLRFDLIGCNDWV